MRTTAALAHSAWLAASLPEAARFARATRNVAGEQQRLLLRIVRENADTDFGRRHRFDRIRTVADYQSAVPQADYAGFADAIARIAGGEARVLTSSPVVLLEPTSGSAGDRKLIPYTRALQSDFTRGVAVWIADLFLHDPRLLAGRAYWSVSPAVGGEETSPGGISVGFEDEAVYLGGARGTLARAAMAVPSAVRRIDDIETFRYATRLALLRARDLALVSVWHPSFLALLLGHLADHAERLARDIERGTLTPPAPLPPSAAAALRAPASPRRAAEVRQLAARHRGDEPALLHGLWPHLRLVSCWDSADAAGPAAELRRAFPHAAVQGKGLLATEGFVSLPLRGLVAPLLAVRSHFFEFEPPGGGPPVLAHELASGSEYAVVLTTSGGLYRYRLGDRVRCVGHHHGCPMLTFLGREGDVSDRVGEKLSDRFVRDTMARVFAARGLGPRFALLAWRDAGYALCVEAAAATDGELTAAAEALDEALSANPHYAYARRLGQLAALRTFRIEGDGHAAHLAACVARGQRLGDVKPAALWRHAGWARTASGRWLPDRAEAVR